MEFMERLPNGYRLLLYFLFAIFLFTQGLYLYLKKPKYRVVWIKAIIFLIVVGISAIGINNSFLLSDRLDPMLEAHEFYVLSAAYGFVDQGFDSNLGLPDVRYYDPRADLQWYSSDIDIQQPKKSSVIYTHLPPGEYWLGGLLVKICGKGKLSCYRLSSTIINTLGLSFFAIMIFLNLSPYKSVVLIFLIAIVPMTGNILHTLAYVNWSFSLFIIQLGFLLYFFKKKVKLSISHLTILLIVSFIQGWFSYDYFSLIILSPFTVALLYSPLEHKEDKKRLVLSTIFIFIGFCFACLLHLIQNFLYFGSIMETVNDMLEIGITRVLDHPRGWKGDFSRTKLLLDYLFVYPRMGYFFIINIPILIGITLVLIWFRDITISIQKPILLNLKWISYRRYYLVIITAILASFLWPIIMFNHAAEHAYIEPRLQFFSYFICLLTILECINIESMSKLY